MQTKTLEQLSTYLEQKENMFLIDNKVVAHELDIGCNALETRRMKNMDLPPYIRLGKKSNSKIVTTIFDLAYYLATDTVGVLTIEDRQKYIYAYLNNKYPRITLSKQEFANELGVNLDTLKRYMENGSVGRFKKHGISKNAKVTFNTVDLSTFLSVTVQTM